MIYSTRKGGRRGIRRRVCMAGLVSGVGVWPAQKLKRRASVELHVTYIDMFAKRCWSTGAVER